MSALNPIVVRNMSFYRRELSIKWKATDSVTFEILFWEKDECDENAKKINDINYGPLKAILQLWESKVQKEDLVTEKERWASNILACAYQRLLNVTNQTSLSNHTPFHRQPRESR